MQKDIDILVDKYIDVVKEVVGNIPVKSIKQYHRDREKGYKTISCVIELEKYKIRFAYHVNEGAVFKRGIITVYYNIRDLEYHFSDILSHIAPRDKDIIVFPYVDDVDTIRSCVNLLWQKVKKYEEKIVEMINNPELNNRLEKSLRKEIKMFSGKKLPDGGPLALMLSGIYANTSLIRYTSKPYGYFVNGNYTKAIKLYNKESNLALYEQQLVKFMKRALKTKKKADIPEYQKTINHEKNIKKETFKYTVLSFFMLLPIMFAFSMLLFDAFSYVVNTNAIISLKRNYIFLLIPATAFSISICRIVRDYVFKSKLLRLFKFKVLYNTEKHIKNIKIIINSIIVASIITISLLAASSITLRADGMKYSTDILDFKGTIVPYNEIQGVNIENSKILLKNGEEILLETFDYTINDLKNIKKLLEEQFKP